MDAALEAVGFSIDHGLLITHAVWAAEAVKLLISQLNVSPDRSVIDKMDMIDNILLLEFSRKKVINIEKKLDVAVEIYKTILAGEHSAAEKFVTDNIARTFNYAR